MMIITDRDLLKRLCIPVRPSERKEYKSIIDEMKTFVLEKEGLGLAAPQVGIQKTFFVFLSSPNKIEVAFNPSILRFSTETIEYDESCFSCPGVVKKTWRSKQIKVKYYDSLWNEKRRVLEDTQSVVFQHELDHLNGVLISDIV